MSSENKYEEKLPASVIDFRTFDWSILKNLTAEKLKQRSKKRVLVDNNTHKVDNNTPHKVVNDIPHKLSEDRWYNSEC